MALKAIQKFDVGSGAWRELAVICGSKAGFFSVGQGSEAAVLLGSMEGWLNSAGGGGRTLPKLGHLTLKDCSPQALEWVSCSIAQ